MSVFLDSFMPIEIFSVLCRKRYYLELIIRIYEKSYIDFCKDERHEKINTVNITI